MGKIIKTAGLVAALTILFGVYAAAQETIEGAWKIKEIAMYFDFGKNLAFIGTQPSIVMFTKTHFSMVAVIGEKPRPDFDQLNATDAQRVAIWMPFIALAGTYDRKETTLIFHDEVSKDPVDMKPGYFYTVDYKMEANTLILSVKANKDGPLPNPMVIKLSRLE
jgi:hypothetical protein